jgi:ATP-dependent DNA helicase RecG
MIEINHEVSNLKGVGPLLQEKLNSQNISIIEDLLFLLPLKYEDRTQLFDLEKAPIDHRCLVKGEIIDSKILFYGRRTLQVIIDDGTEKLKLRFFYFSNNQYKQFKLNETVVCFGLLKNNNNKLEMIHPEYKILNIHEKFKTEETLTPIYPVIDGIKQGRVRNLVQQATNILKFSDPKDLIPSSILDELDLPALKASLLSLHNPPKNIHIKNIDEELITFKNRLSFEELLAYYVSLKNLRKLALRKNAVKLYQGEMRTEQFINSLNFKLTSAQIRVTNEILDDLSLPRPMMRMLQGDVGSGKTIVAAIACLKAILNKKQAAFMAPTELLAQQHFESLTQLFEGQEIKIAILTGSLKQSTRKNIQHLIQHGKIDLIIGTHALFQDGVIFKNLSLIVIDEQHRFGVKQRVAFREKGTNGNSHPHQLIMTATPIPRTLAMAAYADLDTSIIDELPSGRKPIKTLILSNNKRKSVIEKIKIACQNGQQAYWVCPLIDESDKIEADAAKNRFQDLSDRIKSIKIGLIHGRQKNKDKEMTMLLFKEGKIDLLVATTVIEVGVDVPNANLMVIENSERMGLSQLHQLRGRVGRGNKESHCILLYKSPLNTIAKERLSVLRDSNDGFYISQKDLELRGPGEILGKKQTGLPQYRIANISRDANLMPKVQKTAEIIMKNFPNRTNDIVSRWLGSSEKLGKV